MLKLIRESIVQAGLRAADGLLDMPVFSALGWLLILCLLFWAGLIRWAIEIM